MRLRRRTQTSEAQTSGRASLLFNGRLAAHLLSVRHCGNGHCPHVPH
ncbi:MAG: hypothetical protein M5U34_10415 [Chloroflexi bacterium]|nr:hypothetical protein [Chloroflexota bacterium]